ncbi:hypothetical protein DNTS_009411 [Danionella cerebrum]|uniref:trypsin n=1 Tax=Danionella cerebrum TaxID=2873325 RepID=A0A553NGD9_9TELE|nr:hypothetical protein DNTS_009411 [Danionella translucida]
MFPVGFWQGSSRHPVRHKWEQSRSDPVDLENLREPITGITETNKQTEEAEESSADASSQTTNHNTEKTARTGTRTQQKTEPGNKTPPARDDSLEEDGFWDVVGCPEQNFTRDSCSKVFCPPWKRCIKGVCACKMPYMCEKLKEQKPACALDGTQFISMCLINANKCRDKSKPTFSHYNSTCSDIVEAFNVTVEEKTVVGINIASGKKLICGDKWNMAAANVFCKSRDITEGATIANKVDATDQLAEEFSECVKVRCTGAEHSLAECRIYKPEKINNHTKIAAIKCYNKKDTTQSNTFRCVNGKYVKPVRLCDGVDDCGDNSDEMCCKKCRRSAFHCPSGVCIPQHAVRDGVRDCLGGIDEDIITDKPSQTNDTEESETEAFYTDPLFEIRAMRSQYESKLQCGIPNMDYTYKADDSSTSSHRQKRLVGGEEALPTQIQWQVAIQEDGSIHCGGVYLGGCWVLTAAHCVRSNPKSFRVKFSLWEKHRQQSTTDSIPVKRISIHPQYNSQTYANDIAVLLLEELKLKKTCMLENPAVRSVCVPWSTLQFPPDHTCTISGWGRDREGKSASILKWANVTLIKDCQNYYKDRFLPGMECAGNVDSCQGDSGGPLVCKDDSGLSYVWGLVSWGDKCGEPGYPGVYTKVAHYFDWIRSITGTPAVAKFNQ